MLSGLLVVIWFPLVFRLPATHEGIAGYSTAPYLHRWLMITAVLFATSAIAFTIRHYHRG